MTRFGAASFPLLHRLPHLRRAWPRSTRSGCSMRRRKPRSIASHVSPRCRSRIARRSTIFARRSTSSRWARSSFFSMTLSTSSPRCDDPGAARRDRAASLYRERGLQRAPLRADDRRRLAPCGRWRGRAHRRRRRPRSPRPSSVRQRLEPRCSLPRRRRQIRHRARPLDRQRARRSRGRLGQPRANLLRSGERASCFVCRSSAAGSEVALQYQLRIRTSICLFFASTSFLKSSGFWGGSDGSVCEKWYGKTTFGLKASVQVAASCAVSV